jgi:hypothetical protein
MMEVGIFCFLSSFHIPKTNKTWLLSSHATTLPKLPNYLESNSHVPMLQQGLTLLR